MVCEIQTLINEWYGCDMPCRILSKQEEIQEFENDHPEIPPVMWEYVNHHVRVWRMWCNDVVDIVVKRDGKFMLVNDICYVAEYENTTAWHRAIGELLRQEQDWWVALHQE